MEENKCAATFQRKKVVHAAKTLKTLHAKWLENKAKKLPLLGDIEDAVIILQITMKKIPETKNIQMIKIPLPYTLISDTTEVCLFTGDLDRKDKKAEVEPTVEHYKDFLRSRDVKSVTDVIPLRQLRTDYKSYEAKRKLVAGYDVFLADDKIVGCLPRVLGKFFFKKHKFPQKVNLKRPNLKDHIEKTLSSTILFLTGNGNSCCVEVACLKWPTKRIVDNVMAVLNVLEDKLPGSIANICGLHLKTQKSASLPIYLSFESGNDVQLLSSELQEDVEAEEITSLKKNKVKIYSSGDVELVPDDEYIASGSDSDYETELLAENKLGQKKSIRGRKSSTNK